MRSLNFILAFAAIIASCGQKSGVYEQVQLPFEFNSKHPESIRKMFADTVTRATVFESGDVSAMMIVSDDMFPYIVTFYKGSKTDTLSFFNAEELGGEDSNRVVKISPDNTLTTIDSTYAVMADEEGNIREDVRSLNVKTTVYKITATGAIETVSEKDF